jgi:hypothetical protein
MYFFKHLSKVARSFSFPKLSSSRCQLIKADALLQYGHYDEALLEAQKARDDKYASALEVEYAKGKMVQVMNEKSKHERSTSADFNVRPR